MSNNPNRYPRMGEANLFEEVILTIKLPVRCSVLGLLCTSLGERYGLGLLFRQAGDYLEFFTPSGYVPPKRDEEEEDD